MARRRGAQFQVDRTPPHSPSRLCGRQLGSHLPLTSHDGRDTGTNLWEDAMSWSEPSVPHTLRRQNEALNSHGTPSCWMMVSSLKRSRAHDRRALLPPNPKDGEEAHPSTPARVGDGRDTDEAGLARGNSKKEGGEESNQTRPWSSCFSPGQLGPSPAHPSRPSRCFPILCGGILLRMVCPLDHSGTTRIINLQPDCSPHCILRAAHADSRLQPSMTGSDASSRRLHSKLRGTHRAAQETCKLN